MVIEETLAKYKSCRLELEKLENKILNRVNNILKIYLKVFEINFRPVIQSNLLERLN